MVNNFIFIVNMNVLCAILMNENLGFLLCDVILACVD
jgi:hypothetical protein